MTSCIDNDFPCQNPDYSEFDRRACSELNNPILADDLVNKSPVCTMLPLNEELLLDDITYKNFTKSIGKTMGVYHLWVEYDKCGDHGTYCMRCVYVGKGYARSRLDSHVSEKWQGSNYKDDTLFATFTPIRNRLAKYYEQLFLDLYDAEFNKEEKSGGKPLYAVWGEDRYCLGTQLSEVSSMSGVTGFDDE